MSAQPPLLKSSSSPFSALDLHFPLMNYNKSGRGLLVNLFSKTEVVYIKNGEITAEYKLSPIKGAIKSMKLTGFEYCSHLSWSTFNIETSLSLIFPNNQDFNRKFESLVQIIDFYAKELKKDKREACLIATSSGSGKFSTIPLLQYPTTAYFKGIGFRHTIPNNYKFNFHSQDALPPKTYKLAFLVTLHTHTRVDGFIKLIHSICTKDSLVLIHVENRFQQYKKELYSGIKCENTHFLPSKRIKTTRDFSELSAVLEGIFKLVDLGSWEYFMKIDSSQIVGKTLVEIYSALQVFKS